MVIPLGCSRPTASPFAFQDTVPAREREARLIFSEMIRNTLRGVVSGTDDPYGDPRNTSLCHRERLRVAKDATGSVSSSGSALPRLGRGLGFVPFRVCSLADPHGLSG